MPHVNLTAKQEAFCQRMADGMTQADAYRSAYNAKKMADKTVWKRASELMANGDVAGRVAELKAKLESKQLWSREMSVKGLVAAFKVAQTGGNASGMTGAIKELNAMHGFNEPSRFEVTHKITRIIIEAEDGDCED